MDNTDLHSAALCQEEGVASSDASLGHFSSPDSVANQGNAPVTGELMLHDAMKHSYDGGKDVRDSEEDFLDAEIVQNNVSHLDSGFVPIRARISGDTDDEDKLEDEEDEGEENEEGSLASTESYDSAPEHMAVVPTADLVSPVGLVMEPFSLSEVASSTQQGALRQLDELNNGISSLDTSLPENASSEEEFRSRRMEIAESKSLALDDEVVHGFLDALFPRVQGIFKRSSSARVMPVAKPTVEDDDDTDAVDGSQAETNGGASDLDPLEDGDLPALSARGLRVRGVDDESVDQEDSSLTPLSLSKSETAKPEVSTLEVERGCLNFNEVENQITGENLDAKQPNGQLNVVHDQSYYEQPGLKVQEDEQELENNAKLCADYDAVEKTEDPEVSSSANADAFADTGLNVQQLEDSEQVANRSMDDASLQQIRVSSFPDGYLFGTDLSGIQDESPVDMAGKGQRTFEGQPSLETFPENMESKNKDTLRDFQLEGEKRNGGEESELADIGNLYTTFSAGLLEEDDIPAKLVTPEQSASESVGTGEASGTELPEAQEKLKAVTKELEETFDEKPKFGVGPGLEEQPLAKGVDKKEIVDVQNQEKEVRNTETAEELVAGAELGVAKDKSDIVDVKEKIMSEVGSEEDVIEGGKDTGEWDVEADNDDDDDDDEDEESMAENSLPLAAFVSSKSSAAPATDMPSLGGAGPSLPARPAGLGRSMPSLEHAPRAVQRSSGASAPLSSVASEDNRLKSDLSEGSEDAREKLQMIRVKFLRLAHRLGQSAHNVVVAQVLYRLGLAEQLRGGQGTGRPGPFTFERASVLAEEKEAAGQDDLDFGCTIMVLGKSGVGKSATINSLFDEVKSGTDAFSPATKKVQEIIGTIQGIKLRVIDTPGLLTSFADQRHNVRIMSSVKRFIKKSPPDIVLYFDRLDMQSRDYGDLPLLRTITDTFGAAVWFNAIVVLTHASSAPPDGANGVPVSYEMFVAQRSHVVQQTIRQAAGDMRLMNPVSLVENHAACRTNRAGQCVLPNGQVWKPQLLLLCFASKILAEANSLLKLQDSSPRKPFGVRPRVPPLPFLLSSLLQSRAQLKLPDEQMDDEEVSDSEEEEADSDDEEEYDDLPPFRRLTKDELMLLDKEQRRIYHEELDYREKLFMKKQLRDERARKKEMKRRLASLPKEVPEYIEAHLEEENASAAVPVPMPDMALPPSFDSDNPTHRYRYLDTANQWLVRPVLETHGWDHDSGYDGLNVEKMFVIYKKIPASVSGQITKDKKEANLQMECAASFMNGDGKVTLTGLDIQTIGKDLAYTLRSETRFSNFKRNKTTCGLAVTMLGDTVAAGMKLEDRLIVGKRFKLVVNGGALTGRGDVAYGGSLEASLRDKDYPIGRSFSTLGLSIMNWHGDLAIGGNLQLQFQLGPTMVIGRANLNNRGAGQISIRANSSEQLQMALIGLIPLLRTFINNRILKPSQ